jgi:DNA topoisomerase-2
MAGSKLLKNTKIGIAAMLSCALKKPVLKTQIIQTLWPELVQLGFVTYMITPIVRVVPRSGETLSFYSEKLYKQWYAAQTNPGAFRIKYVKGLGTNTAAEARAIFKKMQVNNLIIDAEGKENMLVAFSKKEQYMAKRKEFVVSSSNRELRELVGPSVRVSDFVTEVYILYARASLVRAIPNVVDGLKPSQRKIVHTLLADGGGDEIKVALLAAKVALKTNYHHGEVSLASAIVHLAHDFVGSTNLNLLEPIGQLGTRLLGGKDAASPRYIFTKLSEVAKFAFDPRDLPLLTTIVEEGQTVEPKFYLPVVPLVLLLGVDGLAVGMSTQIHPRDPKVVVANLRALLDGAPLLAMPPYWRKFKGTVLPKDDSSDTYIVRGACRRTTATSIVIDELPVGTWTDSHKAFLETDVKGVKRVENLSTDEDVQFTVVFESSEAANEVFGGDEGQKALKLVRTIYDRNMNAFDSGGSLRNYENAEAILREFFSVRLKAYGDRKQHMLGALASELEALEQKYNFIQAIVTGKLTIHMQPKEAILEDMMRVVQPSLTKDKAASLLRLPLSSMTEENMQACAKQIAGIKCKISEVEATTVRDLWSSDLDDIESCL